MQKCGFNAAPFPKAYFLSTYFVINIIRQVGILLVVVNILICGRDCYQFLNIVGKSVNWCVDIKSCLFEHIITLGRHLKCTFSVGIEDILEDDVYGLIGVVGIFIAQGSDVLRVNICDFFLT